VIGGYEAMKQFGAAHIGLGWLHSGVENASSKSE
jgi:hypothetical protein